jgi:hypothetical protein
LTCDNGLRRFIPFRVFCKGIIIFFLRILKTNGKRGRVIRRIVFDKKIKELLL